MRQIRLSSQAARDLEDIEEFISKDDPDAARRLIISIGEKCMLLSDFLNILPSGEIDRICA